MPTKKFDVEELREFLTKLIPEEDRAELFAFRSPNAYMCDIELDLSNLEDEIFPDPYIAAFPICTIQLTAPNLSTLTLTTDKHRYNPEESDSYVADLINDYFKDCKPVHNITDRIQFKTICFDSEADMLRFFMSKVFERLHFIFFWNGDKFDVPYISNRLAKHNIDMSLYSPTGQISHRQGVEIPWWPKHRFIDASTSIQMIGPLTRFRIS
jgi:DNA polymerase elongation subunit (family B)